MDSVGYKGVSPVIATILMVLITVGLVAFSYSWFIGLGQNVQNTTTGILDTLTAQNAYLTFDSLSCSDTEIKGYLRAQSGGVNMNFTNFFYVSGGSEEKIEVSGCDSPLATGQYCEFTYGGETCNSCDAGASIKVVISTGKPSEHTISGCGS